MMKRKEILYLVGDFETTIYAGQQTTEVWASAIVPLFTEDVQIFHSISETLDYLINLNTNICLYYHNLKFDGSFWISYLLHSGYKQALTPMFSENTIQKYVDNKDMPNKSLKCLISDMGDWYSITIKVNKHIIELRDSLKLLPFSVERIGKSFKTKHQKLSMIYKGFRYAGCKITDEEKEYISNDVLVIKEAIEIMFNNDHKKLTIGSCCLAEFQKLTGIFDYKQLFPDLTEYQLNPTVYGASNADEYIRKSYKGGWCYVVKGKENKIYINGITADVNSLYPSMMSSESGNRYPYGLPIFWNGNYIPEKAIDKRKYFFIRIKTRFEIKENYLPCIQIKNNLMYKPTEWLETSDIYNSKTNKYYKHYIDLDGNVQPATVTLTLTMTDYYLIKEHYNLYDTEILDGCYFWSIDGLFDTYINKYKKIKQESTGAIRELAKLFLNNLYGKMATNSNSSYKIPYLKDDGSLSFYTCIENNKPVGYIPIGSAITSYARNFTIRAAQANYYGKDKPGFIYADTDSIHCDLTEDKLKNIPVHPVNFCCWKLEASWDKAIFVRQKTYIEHVVKQDGQLIENPYYNVKCAGMPEKCKKLLINSFNWKSRYEWETMYNDEFATYEKEEKEFMLQPRTMTDFKRGLLIPGKLLPKQIKGGIVLMDTTYEMR